MLKIVSSTFLILAIVVSAHGWQTQGPSAKPDAARQLPAGFIVPSEANVRIEPDVRTFVVMAAVNMAGFDYETAGQPLSPARAEIRKDLAKLDPSIKEKLTAYYKSHRRAGVDEATDAARYAALSLTMTQPPGFAIYREQEQSLPEDLRPLADFSPLVSEFYIKSGIRELLPKYMAVGSAYASAYRQPVGELIYMTLEYFHASPETIINMRPFVITSNEPKKKELPKVVARNRTRQVFVIPDPLQALGNSYVRGDILNQKDELLTRRVGDDYIVIVGPSKAINTDAIRQALIRFVIDPLVERHLKAALEFKEPIVALASSVPTAGKAYTASVYLVIRESLAQAAEARMRRIQAQGRAATYGEDEAMYDLAQAYLRGAVLSFHFYDALKGFEQVGIGLEAFFDQMVATTKFDREATRAREFEPVVGRVSEARRAKSTKPVEGEARTMEAVGAISNKVLLSDDLIRKRKYDEARPILESILAAEPNNARALYGMAQVVSQQASAVELDPKADENDKIQAQYDRLQQAIKLYRRVIDNASPESEKWLIQWSHVLLGRIYDFQGFRADAVAEYEKAIAMKEVQYGALKEAMEGMQRPYGQKN
ncbi:MAG: tetratricopeptide repeat protein [Blastocatellia bacterium]